MQQVNYSTNPRSYAQLLSAGVSPAQIKEAINSGLNPSQLPPEYFGMSGGYNPQSVGPGATPTPGIGGIDIPPANMGDPYSYSPSGGPGSMGAFGTTPNFGFPSNFDFGSVPSSSTSYLGIPGGVDTSGSMSPMGGNPMGFDTGVTPDWGSLPSSDQSMWTMPNYGDPGSINVGGNPMGFDTSVTPDWWGSLGSPDQSYGFTDPNYSSPAATMSQDVSQSPADVFAGLQDPAGSFSEPGALPSGDVPTPEGWVDGLPPLAPPPGIPDVPADTPPAQVTPDGTALPTPQAGPFIPGATVTSGTPFGSSPGMFNNGTWLAPGSAIGTNFGNMGFSLSGVPGTFVTTPSGQTYNTAQGMFGLGAMNAAGGSWSMTGAGYGDQFSRSASGADAGWGDLGAIDDKTQMKGLKYGIPFGEYSPFLGLANPSSSNASTNWLNSQPGSKSKGAGK